VPGYETSQWYGVGAPSSSDAVRLSDHTGVLLKE